MKIKHIVAATLLLSQTVSAAPNGRPFQELNALIEENASAIDGNGELIEQNSTAILSLSSELSVLDSRVVVLENNVDGFSARVESLETIVTTNSNDIILAFAKISSVHATLSEMDVTIASNTQAINNLEVSMSSTEESIAELNQNLGDLSAVVAVNASAITAVEDDILVAEAHLSSLQDDVVTNADEILSVQNDLNDLNASLASLNAIVDSNVSRIIQTEEDIATATEQLDILTAQHYDLYALIGANADASEEAIASLKTELSALIAANESGIIDNDAELVALSLELTKLAENNSAIAQDLRDQMLALALLVDSNSTSITALQTQVGTLSGALATLNAQYNQLSNLYNRLRSDSLYHQKQIDQLRSEMNGLSGRVDDLEALHAPVYTFTDKYNVNDIAHVDALRDFFIGTPTLNQWVHVIFDTPARGRKTEVCLLDDNNIFANVRNLGGHSLSNNSHYTTKNSYRLNGGAWIAAPSQTVVLSQKDSSRDLVSIRNTRNSYSQVMLTQYAGSPYYDSYHQRTYWSRISSVDTTASYTVAASRFDACGY